MHPDRVMQLARAREMYGKPKEQTNWVDLLNCYFNIYDEMTKSPMSTRTTYAVYKTRKKAQQREILLLPGVFISEGTLERIAIHNETH